MLFSFLRLPDDGLVSRLNAIHDSIAGNAAFPSPPVDLAAFKAAISNYAASIVVALDGSKQAIGNKKKLREVAVNMVEQLGHYVEANSNDDPVTFVSSGFEIRPTNRVPPLPLEINRRFLVSIRARAANCSLKLRLCRERVIMKYDMALLGQVVHLPPRLDPRPLRVRKRQLLWTT